MVLLWADLAAGPVMFLHSGVGIGASVAPILARPFLSANRTVNETAAHPTIRRSSETYTYNGRAPSLLTDLFNPYPEMYDQTWGTTATNSTRYALTPTRIHIPYMIIGLICFSVAICFFIMYLIKMPDLIRKALHEAPRTDTKRMFSPESCTGGSRAFGVQMLVLIFIFCLFVVGVERAYGKFVYSYARKSELKFSKTDSALLNSLYWISFTIARLSGLFAARWIPIHILLFVQCSGSVLSSLLLNVFHNKRTPFWILTSLFGFFQSPLFPSCVGWINRYMDMTPMVAIVMNVGAAVGGIIIQWFTGYLFQNHGPRSFLYTIFAYSLSIAVIFVIMHIIAYRHGDRYSDANTKGNGSKNTRSYTLTKGSKIHQIQADMVQEISVVQQRQI